MFFLTFSLLNYDFTISFYTLALYKVFGKQKLVALPLAELGKPCLTFNMETFTAANTLPCYQSSTPDHVIATT